MRVRYLDIRGQMGRERAYWRRRRALHRGGKNCHTVKVWLRVELILRLQPSPIRGSWVVENWSKGAYTTDNASGNATGAVDLDPDP